jgi:hypothetical protein
LTDVRHAFFGGIASQILRRCHPSDGTIWMCYHNNGYILWFISSERQYPIDKLRSSISSTSIRKSLDENSDHTVYEMLKTLAMNPRELLSILGFPLKLAKVAKSCKKRN